MGFNSLLGSKKVKKDKIFKVKGQGQNLGQILFFLNHGKTDGHFSLQLRIMVETTMANTMVIMDLQFLDLLLRYQCPKVGQTKKFFKIRRIFFQNVA